MQKSSIFVATTASLAFLIAGIAATTLPALFGRHEASSSIVFSAEAAAVLAVIVWVGSCIGARASPPEQRTGRFVSLTAAAYAIVGALMQLPIKTHAVLVNIEGPFPGRTAWDVMTAVAYACFAAVLFSPLIVKAFASMFARRPVGDA